MRPFVCDYRFFAWSGGFVADLTITNHGPAANGWTARWTFPTATANLGVWQARIEQPDAFTMTATNLRVQRAHRHRPVGEVRLDRVGGEHEAPAVITVNGTPC